MSNATKLKEAILKQESDPQEQKDILEHVDRCVDSFRQYFNSVYKHVVGGESNRVFLTAGLIDQQAFVNRITDLDSNRKAWHDAAITACSSLNLMCDVYGVEKFCPEVTRDSEGKATNRGEIADFVGQYVYKVYQSGIHKEPLREIQEEKGIEYGDRTALDTAYSIAKEDGRNPDEAYNKDDAYINPDEGFDLDDDGFDPADD